MNISDAWKAAFDAASPVGFLARKQLPERWLRIHSLPGSKRHPTDELERALLVRRHLEVAKTVLGTGEGLILFLTWFGPAEETRGRSICGFDSADLAHLAELAIPEGDTPTHFFATPFPWDEALLTRLILASADESIGPVLFANLAWGTAYAPYDGGADLFFASAPEAGVARKRWARWLSDRPDGL